MAVPTRLEVQLVPVAQRPTESRQRNVRINLNQYAGRNHDGDLLSTRRQRQRPLHFFNNWRIGWPQPHRRELRRSPTRGGPGAFATGDRELELRRHRHRKPVVRLVGYIGTDRHGTNDVEVAPRLTFRPTAALTISTGVQYSHGRNAQQWIEALEGDHPLRVRPPRAHDRRDDRARQLHDDARLSLQLYAEPFASTGDYTNFKALVNGRVAYEERYAPFEYDGNPDFRYRRSERPTSSVGIQTRLDPLCRLAAGPRTLPRTQRLLDRPQRR